MSETTKSAPDLLKEGVADNEEFYKIIIDSFMKYLQNDTVITDEVIKKVISERIDAIENRFKLSTVSIIENKLKRANFLLEASSKIEDSLFSEVSINSLSDRDKIAAYKELNANISELVKLMDIMKKELSAPKSIQIYNDNRTTEVKLTREEEQRKINEDEVTRRFYEIAKSLQVKKLSDGESN